MSRILHSLDERLQLIIIAILVGICAGVASVALNRSLSSLSGFLSKASGNWYILFFPACGAALSVFFLQYIARDAGGHGVPEVIYSISRRGGLLRFRSSFSRLVACMLTIASGGSAGPEAPVVISGASIGSNIASYVRLRDRQRTVLVGCGAAAAIAAIFNAPMTGIVFSLEAILGEWTHINLIPVAIASVSGTVVSRFLQGNQIPFQHRMFSITWEDLIACIGLSILTAFGSIVLVRSLGWVRTNAARLVHPVWLRAACGGLLVGAIGLLIPDILGEGYETIRIILEEKYATGFLVVGIAVIAKILATTLTIGSGGSGGLFAPCLLVGSFSGLFYQRSLTKLFPVTTWAGEGYFALLGMAGFISSVLQAPMTGIFLIIEITGSYQLLVSVVLVSVISATASHFFEPVSVYHQELVDRGTFIRPRTDRRVLSELHIMEMLERDCCVLHPEMHLKDLVPIVQNTHRNYFPVVNAKTQELLGMIHFDDVRSYIFNPHLYETVLVEELMERKITGISPDDDLVTVFDLFEKTHSWSLPVVQDRQFLGLISKATILDHYRKELIVQEEI